MVSRANKLTILIKVIIFGILVIGCKCNKDTSEKDTSKKDHSKETELNQLVTEEKQLVAKLESQIKPEPWNYIKTHIQRIKGNLGLIEEVININKNIVSQLEAIEKGTSVEKDNALDLLFTNLLIKIQSKLSMSFFDLQGIPSHDRFSPQLTMKILKLPSKLAILKRVVLDVISLLENLKQQAKLT